RRYLGDKRALLKSLLAERGIAMVCLSSGNVRIEPEFEADDLATHTRNARFVRDAGGQFLQLIDSRPKRALVAADYVRMGRLLNEIGKSTADLSVPVVHHH